MTNPFLNASNNKKSLKKTESTVNSRWSNLKETSEDDLEFKKERKNKFMKKTDPNNSSFNKDSGFKKDSGFNKDSGFKKQQGFNKFIYYADDKEKEVPKKEFNLEEQDDDFPALC